MLLYGLRRANGFVCAHLKTGDLGVLGALLGEAGWLNEKIGDESMRQQITRVLERDAKGLKGVVTRCREEGCDTKFEIVWTWGWETVQLRVERRLGEEWGEKRLEGVVEDKYVIVYSERDE